MHRKKEKFYKVGLMGPSTLKMASNLINIVLVAWKQQPMTNPHPGFSGRKIRGAITLHCLPTDNRPDLGSTSQSLFRVCRVTLAFYLSGSPPPKGSKWQIIRSLWGWKAIVCKNPYHSPCHNCSLSVCQYLDHKSIKGEKCIHQIKCFYYFNILKNKKA